MANQFILVGVLKTEEGLKIIDSNKQEHVCTDGDSLKAALEKLLEAEDLPEVETSAPGGSSRRQARERSRERVRGEVHDFEAKVDRMGDGIEAHIASEYGDTIGRHAGDAVTRGTKGLAGFLRKISRK